MQEESGLPGLRQQGYHDFVDAVGELSSFMRDRGAVPEPGAKDRAEARLGSWLDGQRAADRRGRLSAPRAVALEDVLGRDWSS